MSSRITFHKKPGRPTKYRSNSARHEAKLESRRKWYKSSKKNQSRIKLYNKKYSKKKSQERKRQSKKSRQKRKTRSKKSKRQSKKSKSRSLKPRKSYMVEMMIGGSNPQNVLIF